MDIEELWQKAVRNTEILRSYVRNLYTFGSTNLSYIFLAESQINIGDTVIRRGRVVVDQPMLFLASAGPQFEGFKFLEDLKLNTDSITNFLYLRGVRFPSLKYSNEELSIDIFNGSLKKAIGVFRDELEQREDITTSLIVGLDYCWQFSILLFVAMMINRSLPDDLKNIYNKYFRNRQ